MVSARARRRKRPRGVIFAEQAREFVTMLVVGFVRARAIIKRAFHDEKKEERRTFYEVARNITVSYVRATAAIT